MDAFPHAVNKNYVSYFRSDFGLGVRRGNKVAVRQPSFGPLRLTWPEMSNRGNRRRKGTVE